MDTGKNKFEFSKESKLTALLVIYYYRDSDARINVLVSKTIFFYKYWVATLAEGFKLVVTEKNEFERREELKLKAV